MSVVLPAYDEAASVGATITALAEALRHAGPLEILVVDDGSADGTAAAAIATGRADVRVLAHGRNRGYGAAVKTGLRAARAPVVLLADADGQHRPGDAAAVLAALPGADMVVGARQPGSASGWLRGPGRIVLARVAAWLARQPIPDLTSGLRAYRRAAIARYLHLLPDGYSASTTSTLVLLTRGGTVRYVPITTLPDAGRSQLRPLRDGARVALLIVRLIVLLDPLRFFLPASLALVALGLGYSLPVAIVNRGGFPTAGILVALSGVVAFFFGLLAEQVAELRKERYEEPPQ